MFLAIMPETNLRLEVFSSRLISELLDMFTRFSRLSSVPRLDHLHTPTKRSEVTSFARDERTLLVVHESAHSSLVRIGVFCRWSAQDEM